MNSDQKIECDRINNQLRDAHEKIGNLKIQQGDVENNLSIARGKLSDLNDELTVKKGLLFTAQVGSLIPGVGGKVGGAISIPVLEREIQRLEREIERVKSDMDQEQRKTRDAKDEIWNPNHLMRQLEQDKRNLGCS